MGGGGGGDNHDSVYILIVINSFFDILNYNHNYSFSICKFLDSLFYINWYNLKSYICININSL